MPEKIYQQTLEKSLTIDFRLNYLFELRYTFHQPVKLSLWIGSYTKKDVRVGLTTLDRLPLTSSTEGDLVVSQLSIPSITTQTCIQAFIYSESETKTKNYSNFISSIRTNLNSSKLIFTIKVECDSSLDTFKIDSCTLRLLSIPFNLVYLASSNVILNYLLNNNKSLSIQKIKEIVRHSLIPYNCSYIQRQVDSKYSGILPLSISSIEVVGNRRYYTRPPANDTPPRLEEGVLIVTSQGGSEPYLYKLESDVDYTNGNTFSSLPEGTYRVNVKDSKNTEILSQSVEVTSPAEFKIMSSSQSSTLPSKPFGSGIGFISITISGGIGPYQVNLLTKKNGTYILLKNSHHKQVQSTGVVLFSNLDTTLDNISNSVDYRVETWDVYGKVVDLDNYVLTQNFTLEQASGLSITNIIGIGPLFVGSTEGTISFSVVGGQSPYRVTLNRLKRVTIGSVSQLVSTEVSSVNLSISTHTFTGLGVDIPSDTNTLTTGIYTVTVTDSLGTVVTSQQIILSVRNEGDYNIDYGNSYN